MKTKPSPKGAKSKSAAKSAKPAAAPTSKALFYTLTLIAAALAILVLSSYILPHLEFIENLRSGVLSPSAIASMEAELGSFIFLRLLLSVANIALLVYLLYIYVKDYLVLRTNFALGLVAFLFSFLLYALATVPILRLFAPFRGPGPDIFSFVPLLFSAIGLVIFAKLSNE